MEVGYKIIGEQDFTGMKKRPPGRHWARFDVHPTHLVRLGKRTEIMEAVGKNSRAVSVGVGGQIERLKKEENYQEKRGTQKRKQGKDYKKKTERGGVGPILSGAYDTS